MGQGFIDNYVHKLIRRPVLSGGQNNKVGTEDKKMELMSMSVFIL